MATMTAEHRVITILFSKNNVWKYGGLVPNSDFSPTCKKLPLKYPF